MTRQVFLIGQSQKAFAKKLIDQAAADDVVTISKATRTLRQNARLHPMIEDIRRQLPSMAGYTRDDIKLRFLNALGTELRFLPELDGQGMFPVGLRSSTLTVEQFSGLIELLFQFGAKHGVKWTDPTGEREAA